jgi:hypothetical protein
MQMVCMKPVYSTVNPLLQVVFPFETFETPCSCHSGQAQRDPESLAAMALTGGRAPPGLYLPLSDKWIAGQARKAVTGSR